MKLPEAACQADGEGYLLDLVVARGERAAHSMADLVVRHQGLALAVRHGRALHASHDAVHAVVDLRQRDGALGAPACQDGSLHGDRRLRCEDRLSSLSTQMASVNSQNELMYCSNSSNFALQESEERRVPSGQCNVMSKAGE